MIIKDATSTWEITARIVKAKKLFTRRRIFPITKWT
jgi:hypothetical protein